jgi:6-phosphogluconolactonase
VNPGAGPRHFAFHPNGRYAYVINELQSTVTGFAWNAKAGVLKEIQTITTLPAGFSGENYTAEVVVHPSGRFLYGSNRGHDSIAVFAIDSKGMLKAVEQTPTQGKTPRNFNIDPTGSHLFAANQNTNNVVVFRIDTKTGRLSPIGKALDVPIPVCIRFVSAD